MVEGKRVRILVFVFSMFISSPVSASDSSDECEQKYVLPQPPQKIGKHAMRSQQDLDAQECSSKVGSDFCTSNLKTTYMQACAENMKNEQQKRLEEATAIQEKIKSPS